MEISEISLLYPIGTCILLTDDQCNKHVEQIAGYHQIFNSMCIVTDEGNMIDSHRINAVAEVCS